MGLINKLIAIANAIRAKTGTTEPMTLDAMAIEIENIKGGTSSSEVTATKAQVLAGYTTITNDSDNEIAEGTMPNNGSWTGATTGSGNVAIPAGYHDGSGYVSGSGAYNSAQSEYEPTSATLGNDGKLSVKNNGGTEKYSTTFTNNYNKGVSDTKVGTAGNGDVLSGKTYTNSSSVGANGTMSNNGAVSSSVGVGGSYTVPAGYHNGSGKISGPTLSGNATVGYVYSGKTFYSNSGTKQTGTMSVASLTSFSAAVSNGRAITLSWKVPAAATGKPYSGVIIRYGTSQPTSTSAGTLIYMGEGSSTTAGSTSTVTVNLPNFNTTYYFSMWFYVTCSAGSSYNSKTVLISSDYKTASAKTGGESWVTKTSGSYTIPSGCKADVYVIAAGCYGSYGICDYISYSNYVIMGGDGGRSGYITTKTGLSAGTTITSISVGASVSSYKSGSTSCVINGTTVTALGYDLYSSYSGYYKKGGTSSYIGEGQTGVYEDYNGKGYAANGSNGLSLNGTYYSSSGGGGGASMRSRGDLSPSSGGSGAGGGGAAYQFTPGSCAVGENGGSATTYGSGGGGGGAALYSSTSRNNGSGGAGMSGAVIIRLY